MMTACNCTPFFPVSATFVHSAHRVSSSVWKKERYISGYFLYEYLAFQTVYSSPTTSVNACIQCFVYHSLVKKLHGEAAETPCGGAGIVFPVSFRPIPSPLVKIGQCYNACYPSYYRAGESGPE